MKWNKKALGIFATTVVCIDCVMPQIVQAGDFYKPFRFLKQPFEAAHREKPATEKDNSIEQLANEIDWLEHHIDKYGSIVAKHPDIWGQSRLMRHRYEYEKEMEAQISRFEVRMNGALRRSDQAFLGMALAIQGAATGKVANTGVAIGIPNPAEAATIFTNLNATIPSTNQNSPTDQTTVIQRTQPFQTASAAVPPGFSFNQPNISLEPTTQLDQMSRYLNHLHELRRINEGDDIADSPGYSLNLVRIPVSVTPGKQTQKGYGAEVTVIASPFLSEDLLPSTMRNMVINDAVDLIAPTLTFIVNDEDVRDDLREAIKENVTTMRLKLQEPESRAMRANSSLLQSTIQSENERPNTAYSKYRATAQLKIANARSINVPSIPSTTHRRARLPVPLSQVPEIFGSDQIISLCYDIYKRLAAHPASQPTISYLDVRAHLHEELQASYDLLKGESFRALWHYGDAALANAIRERRMRWVDEQRCRFLNEICIDYGQPKETSDANQPPCLVDMACGVPTTKDYKICNTVTAGLAWALIVESSLLNERLTEDMRDAATSKGCHCVPDQCGPFYGPYPSPEACQAFNEYVRCRWPVRVFALDPTSQDQNIADSFARRRELQVAVALAFASGQMNAQSLMRYTRRLEWDMATIDINRTSVGFSHGNDTFGWRFHPRFQTPPVKGTISTFGETLFGGPSTNSDIRSRHLEAGMRECTAIVVMPSFVPYMTFDVRTNWFKLTNPKCTEISMKETLTLSRSIQTMKQSAAACAPCSHLYRDGEVHRLLRRVDQLDRELPLQTMQAQIPYENTSGGFELFNTGITDLAPELIGWYGAPGINPSGATTLYLIGKGFSVHSTQLIAGGRNLPFNLISRQVMQVEVPPGAQVLQRSQEGEGRLDQVVDIHLATPYGVSGHLLVPVAKSGAVLSKSGGDIAWRANSKLSLSAIIIPGASTGAPKTVEINNFFSASSEVISIDVPQVSPVPGPINIKIFVRDVDGTFIGTFASPVLNFDAANSSIYVTGNELNTIVGAKTSNSIGFVAKEYIAWKANQQGFSKGLVNLVVSAALDQGIGRPLVPISGGLAVDVDVTTKP